MERLDKLLLTRHPDFSRSRIEGLVKAGYVTVNGATATKAGAKVSDADDIVVEIPPPVPAIPEPEDIPLDIVYEDDDLVVVNKAPGMVVHPAPGHYTGTLVNALLHHCPNLSGIGGVARPGIVHRLDQYTSGILIVAKTQRAMDSLVHAFSTHRDIEKTYLAVCHRTPQSPALTSGRIENLIGRHPVDRKRMAIVEKGGKLAITNWKVKGWRGEGVERWRGEEVERWRGEEVERLSSTTPPFHHSTTPPPHHSTTPPPHHSTIPPLHHSTILIECRIETGRTHQIRVHMASLGCPVVGDAVYGRHALDAKLDPVPTRQLLHAWRLKIRHPADGREMLFEAPVPEDMKRMFE